MVFISLKFFLYQYQTLLFNIQTEEIKTLNYDCFNEKAYSINGDQLIYHQSNFDHGDKINQLQVVLQCFPDFSLYDLKNYHTNYKLLQTSLTIV